MRRDFEGAVPAASSIPATAAARQIPLDFQVSEAASRILSDWPKEAVRVRNLLLDWALKYGKTDIQSDDRAIIVGKHRISISDVNQNTAFSKGLAIGKDVLFSPDGRLLSDAPADVELVDPFAWMALADAVPGMGEERRDNLLELL